MWEDFERPSQKCLAYTEIKVTTMCGNSSRLLQAPALEIDDTGAIDSWRRSFASPRNAPWAEVSLQLLFLSVKCVSWRGSIGIKEQVLCEIAVCIELHSGFLAPERQLPNYSFLSNVKGAGG